MDQSIDEAMTVLRPWIGRVRTTEDDIGMPMVRRIAAMLDLDPDTFRLLLRFLKTTTGTEPAAMRIANIDAPAVLAFLLLPDAGVLGPMPYGIGLPFRLVSITGQLLFWSSFAFVGWWLLNGRPKGASHGGG